MSTASAFAHVARLAAAYAADPLLRYELEPPGHRGGAAPWQRAAHESQARKRLIRAANRIGKSHWAAAESWYHLLGRHPYRPTPGPGSLGWGLFPDLTSSWPAVSSVLLCLEPPGTLAPNCGYVDGVGYVYRSRKAILLDDKHGGGLFVAKGCDQKVLALELERLAWAWVDEPPKRPHWDALRARLTMDLSPLWATLSPIGRPCGWLRAIVDGDPEEGTGPEETDWYQAVVELRVENAPHRTPESVEVQIAECPAHERAQRIRAEWEGFSIGRMVAGFGEANIADDDEVPKDAMRSVGLGWDHGEKPGAQICYLVAQDATGIVWVLGEAVSHERSTPAEDATRARDMLREWGLELEHVAEARGDSNSAGKLGLGWSVNQYLEREFARLAGKPRPPFRIATPYKAPGSIQYRARLMNTACLEGRLRVHRSCRRLQHSLRHWMGEESDLKHPFDACVPGDTPILTADGPVPIAVLAKRRRAPLAAMDLRAGRLVLRDAIVKKTGTDKPLIRIVHEEGALQVTAEHPVLVNGNFWRPAGSVRFGDLLTFAGTVEQRHGISWMLHDSRSEERERETLPELSASRVLAVASAGVADVYNAQVEEHENYVADGVIVHNCSYIAEVYLSTGGSRAGRLVLAG